MRCLCEGAVALECEVLRRRRLASHQVRPPDRRVCGSERTGSDERMTMRCFRRLRSFLEQCGGRRKEGCWGLRKCGGCGGGVCCGAEERAREAGISTPTPACVCASPRQRPLSGAAHRRPGRPAALIVLSTRPCALPPFLATLYHRPPTLHCSSSRPSYRPIAAAPPPLLPHIRPIPHLQPQLLAAPQ